MDTKILVYRCLKYTALASIFFILFILPQSAAALQDLELYILNEDGDAIPDSFFDGIKDSEINVEITYVYEDGSEEYIYVDPGCTPTFVITKESYDHPIVVELPKIGEYKIFVWFQKEFIKGVCEGSEDPVEEGCCAGGSCYIECDGSADPSKFFTDSKGRPYVCRDVGGELYKVYLTYFMGDVKTYARAGDGEDKAAIFLETRDKDLWEYVGKHAEVVLKYGERADVRFITGSVMAATEPIAEEVATKIFAPDEFVKQILDTPYASVFISGSAALLAEGGEITVEKAIDAYGPAILSEAAIAALGVSGIASAGVSIAVGIVWVGAEIAVDQHQCCDHTENDDIDFIIQPLNGGEYLYFINHGSPIYNFKIVDEGRIGRADISIKIVEVDAIKNLKKIFVPEIGQFYDFRTYKHDTQPKSGLYCSHPHPGLYGSVGYSLSALMLNYDLKVLEEPYIVAPVKEVRETDLCALGGGCSIDNPQNWRTISYAYGGEEFLVFTRVIDDYAINSVKVKIFREDNSLYVEKDASLVAGNDKDGIWEASINLPVITSTKETFKYFIIAEDSDGNVVVNNNNGKDFSFDVYGDAFFGKDVANNKDNAIDINSHLDEQLDAYIIGSLNDNEDWYKFPVQKGQEVSVNIESFELGVELVDSENNILDSMIIVPTGGGSYKVLKYTASNTEDIYLKISRPFLTLYNTYPIKYSFKVSIVGEPNEDEEEPGIIDDSGSSGEYEGEGDPGNAAIEIIEIGNEDVSGLNEGDILVIDESSMNEDVCGEQYLQFKVRIYGPYNVKYIVPRACYFSEACPGGKCCFWLGESEAQYEPPYPVSSGSYFDHSWGIYEVDCFDEGETNEIQVWTSDSERPNIDPDAIGSDGLLIIYDKAPEIDYISASPQFEKIIIEVKVRDGIELDTVEFYVNGVLKGTKSMSGTVDTESYTLYTSSYSQGEELGIRAIVYDSIGNWAESNTVTVNVMNDPDPPTIDNLTISAVDKGVFLNNISGVVNIGISVTDQISGITAIKWYLDDIFISSGPTILLDTQELDEQITLRVVAEDNAGNSAQKEFNLNVDNIAPVINNINLNEGATVEGVVNLVADVSDNKDIKKVEWIINEEIVAIGSNTTWLSSKFEGGNYNLTLKVRDIVENVNENIVHITILSPDIFINSSKINATRDQIEVTLDNLGNKDVEALNVTFYNNTQLIASIVTNMLAMTNKNANISWNASDGMHNISVIADHENLIIESNEFNNQGFLKINVTNEIQERTLNLSQGQNLISIPIEPIDPNVSSLFGSTVSSVKAWNGSSYVEVESVVPMHGYWVEATEDAQINITGYTVTDPTLPLNVGWNLVGPADYVQLPLSDPSIVGSIWTWDGEKYIRETLHLEPTKAYWIAKIA